MTIGLKLRQALEEQEEEIRRKAAKRRAESDAILEIVYAKLLKSFKAKKEEGQ